MTIKVPLKIVYLPSVNPVSNVALIPRLHLLMILYQARNIFSHTRQVTVRHHFHLLLGSWNAPRRVGWYLLLPLTFLRSTRSHVRSRSALDSDDH